MKALLIMAHGSPRPEANDDIRAVAEVIRSRNEYPIVEIGYLDCNDPDIGAAVDLCVAAGTREIVAVPYFLHSGKHFVRDLPDALRDAALRHPGVAIQMGDYLGRQEAMSEVLRDRIAAIK
jgi:sirohydrochlorin ferrochelatase